MPNKPIVNQAVSAASILGSGGPLNRRNLAVDEHYRERATILESAKASASTWSIDSIQRAWNRPEFPPQEDFKVSERMDLMPFAPTEAEERILRKTSSDSEFDYEVNFLKERREAQQKMGDNPLTSFVVGAMDVGHLAVDAATLGTARALRLRRLTAGALAGGGTGALTALEYQNTPLEYQDVVAATLMNAAAVSALHRTPQRKVEAETFNREAIAASRNIGDEVDVTVSTRVSKDGEVVVQANPKDSPLNVKDSPDAVIQINKVLDEAAELRRSQVDSGTLPKFPEGTVPLRKFLGDSVSTGSGYVQSQLAVLSGKLGGYLDTIPVRHGSNIKHSNYDRANNVINLREGATPNEVLHEVAHAATANKIEWGKANPNSEVGQLVQQLEQLRQHVLKNIDPEKLRKLDSDTQYALGSGVRSGNELDEFVAGFFSDSPDLHRIMRELPAPNTSTNRSTLQRLGDLVRRVLGLNKREADTFFKTKETLDGLLDSQMPNTAREPFAQWLNPDPVYANPNVAQATSLATQQADGWAKQLGLKLGWNLKKTLDNLTSAKEDIRKLVADPLDPSHRSVSSIKRSNLAELEQYKIPLDRAIAKEMANRGIKWYEMVSTKAQRTQRQITDEVVQELVRREAEHYRTGQFTRQGNPAISELADLNSRLQQAAHELEVRSGVFGADGYTPNPHYFPRRWNDGALSDMDVKFNGDEAAIAKEFSKAIRSPNLNAKEKLAMATAILDRTRRKGDMTDTTFRGQLGQGATGDIMDVVRRQGIDHAGQARIEAVLMGKVDEAGKASHHKSRIDLDMSMELRTPSGELWTPLDIMERDLLRLNEQRLELASGSSAMAEMGYVLPRDIDSLRERVGRGADRNNRRNATHLLENTLDSIYGRPVGEDMTNMMRIMSAVTQMVGLAYSGLWQVTEYAKMAMRYGLLNTTREVVRELPLLRTVAREDSRALRDVLAKNAYQDIRMRPFLSRLEDGFDISESSAWLHAAQKAKQLVPYLNGMVYVQRHQARVSANLIMNTLEKAAKGDTKATKALSKYGVDSNLLGDIRTQMQRHGDRVDNWDSAVWNSVRDPLTRIVDDNVLRSKLGEIPAYAQFSTLGKFIFTFRSFVLGAHNKILAGTLTQDGAGAYALMMAYQLPLTLAMTQAASVLRGNGLIDDNLEWAAAGVSQAGGFGLFSDLFAAAMGGKHQLGSPSMIAAERAFSLFNAATTFDQGIGGWAGGTGKALLNATPLLGVVPFVKGAHKLWE